LQKGRTRYPFVKSSENGLGIGKVTAIEGELATVEYFRSPLDDEPIRRQVAKSSLSRKVLHSETRAYYYNPETDAIEVGRVLDYQPDDERYLVRFPNEQARMLSSDEFQVRCQLPILEPTENLARQINETAFWHAARSRFVQHLLKQHEVSGGLSALLSSSIEIVSHQVAVIHQVLTDPFQRYLLADEVGLGKTIEAGVLIKQFTLDAPGDHAILVIVPETLLIQWKQELTHRFHLGRLIGRSIHIVSSQNQAEIKARVEDARMIVIDEAHHLSSWAWSPDHDKRAIFDRVAAITKDLHRRVLLLSATPVLHNEKSFLAMLHLLDPQVYSLDGLAAFKKRVQLRQEIAERMMDLREDESNFFLGDTLEVLGDLLDEDCEFQTLRQQLSELVEADVDEQDPVRIQLIRQIRSHVSDMWRLHRRILRSRRTVSTSAYLPGRGGAHQIVYVCDKEAGLAEAIEAWRLTLSASLFAANEQEKKMASDLARAMDELGACEPRKVVDLAETRLHDGDLDANGNLPLCEGEFDSLVQIIRAARECDHAARLRALYQAISQRNTEDSCVIFASEPETADLIYEYLVLRFAKEQVLRHSKSSFKWTQFKSESRGYILVCDRCAEEGLNLQKRGTCAIHYDLPFSPNRIEQRMGRLDRFGRGTPVQSLVLACDGSNVQKQWYDLVERSLGVFHSSIASLQYVIEDTMQEILVSFLDQGSDAFAQATKRLGGDEGLVATEFKRIRAQDSLDSFDSDVVTQEFVDELERNDHQLGRTSAAIFGNWAVRNLRFRSTGEEKPIDDVFTYEFTRKVDYGARRPLGKDTLIPVDEFERYFAESIDNVPLEPPARFTTVPLTFDRVTSQRRACRLLRVGDPFADAFEAFTRWDDRGISYAFWRYAPSFKSGDDPAVFFKFDFVIAPAQEPLSALCSRHIGANLNAVLRRSRAVMQPRFTSMWLDADLSRVMSSDYRRRWIDPLFNKSPTVIGEDFNLNRRRWSAVAELYDMSLWRDRCIAARERAEELLREESGLPAWSEDCVSKATLSANRIQQQFQSRLALAVGELKVSLEAERQFESELLDAQKEAFRKPELRVDSVGAVFVSNQMPFRDWPSSEDEN